MLFHIVLLLGTTFPSLFLQWMRCYGICTRNAFGTEQRWHVWSPMRSFQGFCIFLPKVGGSMEHQRLTDLFYKVFCIVYKKISCSKPGCWWCDTFVYCLEKERKFFLWWGSNLLEIRISQRLPFYRAFQLINSMGSMATTRQRLNIP